MERQCDLLHFVEEEGSGASVKVEGLSKAALIKSLSPRVILSNHLLPKGTKMKVNLEDQGRQKVSFSFAQTKKPLQSLFSIPTSPDKSAGDLPPISSPTNADKRGQVAERKPELKLTPVSPAAETIAPSVVSPATKLKTDLSKMHFKKQILSVSVTEEDPAPGALEEPNSFEVHDLPNSASQSAAEFSLPPPQSSASVRHSENTPAESPETKASPALKKPTAPSGKDSESSTSAEAEFYNRKTRSQSATAPPGSESDGDTAPMSSSHKSADSSRKASSESRNKEVKKSSFNTHVEDKDKGSSKRSENHERSSSYSKSDRDSKHTYSRSSRSDKDRRRTRSRSRSRSRSRGSRTSSSHSRPDRSRGDCGSRSDRSYYHDSDRRSHRGSPRRDRRRSRSRTDRNRDSSDSEDDHRKARTRASDSSRPSAYSGLYKDSKSFSYSKSEKGCKSSDSPHLSEFDKRTQSSKSDRTSKRPSDSDSQRKGFPDLDSSYRKSSSHHKSESHKSSSSSTRSRSQMHERHQKSSSSDSDAEQRGKTHISDRRSGSEESSQKRSSTADSKQVTPPRTSVQTSEPDRQSPNVFQSPHRATQCANTAESCTQRESELSDCHLTGSECNNQTFEEQVASTEKSLQESLPMMMDTDCLNQVNVTLEIYNQSSEDRPHVNSSPAIFSSCNDSLACGLEKEVVGSFPGAALVDKEDASIAQDAQQSCKTEVIELNIVSTVDVPHGTEMSLKSESSCVESRNRVTVKPQLMDTAKKSSVGTKKSRWDIVGQVTSDGDNSQRTLCSEGKPTVKKVISVKEIELPHQQGSDSSQKDIETHSTQGRLTEIWTHDVISKSTEMHRERSEPSQGGNSGQRVSSNAYADNRAANIQICTGDGDREGASSKLSRADGSAGLSEATDSDNSDYDSDCGEVIKRLHSVVVVPKNSSLTIDTHDTVATQCTPFSRSGVQNPSILAHVNTSEVPQQRLGNPPAAFVGTSVTRTHVNDSSFNSLLCQSQSNMIDSTSHSEASASIRTQPYTAGDISVQGTVPGPTHGDFIRQCEQECKQGDTSSRGEKMYSHYQPVHFSNADNINGKIGFSLGWGFSQPEQPSSTYQQPDSSHGPHLASTKMTGAFLQHQEHMQSTALWNHQSLNMQSSGQNFHHMHQHYQETTSVVHPDSLTNDHDDYSGEKRSKTDNDSTGSISHPLDPSSFVQGHEISSNSRGSIVSDPPRDDHLRPHRGRGPPKKRRPEVESDSDNEAEAGPADKRERLGDIGTSKETQAKTDAHRPSLSLQDFHDANKWKEHSKSKKMPPYFDLIEENLYLTERKKSKSHRDIKRMQCECPVLPREERSKGALACGEDCLNRLLMIECSSRCQNGAYCSNRRFQMRQHADFDVILTEDKGWGLRAAKDLPSNTFVLEYCGEVLDHKEFKTRVKEYARNKNIHYYFMALKNNEIIDATLKGNLSRFMNHSCEPNCETQKWTVNGQLRVGFFTTKAVTAGTELTFDYQFQRYGKEAQKCFCGTLSCRGFLGGENRVSVRAAGGKMKKDRSRKSALTTVDEELEALLENGEGLYDEKQVVSLCRLMVRVETMEQKLMCLKLIQDTQNSSCLKQFLDHHGLSLLWIFMVELSEAKGNSSNNTKLQLEILKTLAVLPISTKNMLAESKVLTFIQRWAQTKSILQPAEMDGYSSENTSRAQTPLNTPDGTSSKVGQELDSDNTKPVSRRLKIISENSLDSAISDASKVSDGKEEEDDEEEEEEESSNANGKLLKADPGGEATDPGGEATDPGGEAADPGGEAADPGGEAADLGGEPTDPGGKAADPGGKAADLGGEAADLGGEPTDPGAKATDPGGEAADLGGEAVDPGGEAADLGGEAADLGGEAADLGGEAADLGGEAADLGGEAADLGGEAADPGGEVTDHGAEAAAPGAEAADPTKGAVVDPVEEEQKDPDVNSDTQREETERGLDRNITLTEVSTEGHSDRQMMPVIAHKEQSGEEQLRHTASEMTDLEGHKPDFEAESQPMQVDAVDVPPQNNETEVTKQDADKAASGSEEQPGETSTDATLISETPEACVPSEVSQATPAETSVIGTPSQDEEEGVSDVESERSQEPQLNALDVSTMASRLLESWKDLKEVYRIPKKSQVEKEANDRSRDRDTAFTPRSMSSSRERERERDKDRERDRDRDYDRDRDWDRDWDRDRDRDRDRSSDKTPRSTERRRRRSTSPPSSYERSSRRTEERFDPSNSNKTPRGAVGGKERNKLSTEERRKLFEQEVAQREAQKQQQLQQQQQQQLQTMAYNAPLAYTSSPGFVTYPPGYPMQTFVDPSNPNAGKVLLPTPSVEPTLTYEQTPSQQNISDIGLNSPSSTSQATPVSNLSHHITTTNLTTGSHQQYVQPTVATQDAGVAVLPVPAQTAPQVQGQQSYTTLWDPTTQQTVTVQAQPAQQYTAAPAQAQPQTAIYYQGQPCQTIYSIPTAYPQPNTPVIQAYSEPTASYLHSQPVYSGHQQGVVVQQGGTVTTIVTSQTVQQEMIVPNNVIDLPPPSPPKPKTIVLPPNWKVARDPEGKIYYYHIVTRQTQWDPPTWEGGGENTNVDHESEMDLGTPTYDENPNKVSFGQGTLSEDVDKFSTKTAEADTSSELAKKSKETFRKEMSQFIVQCLNPYRKPDCKLGRISNTEDFKHLARKLTHGVMNKELKACTNPEDLECNENVKHKAKEYIKKYMQRFGSVYRPKEDTEVF
eukprot:XP_011603986.1 PREDICTED: histone-lysine N-methyltransferase SETD2 isoform X1 [Takifugu rubripes]